MRTTALRRTAGLVTIGLMVTLLAATIPAAASEATITGDCDGWSIHLDGNWGAYMVTIDGVIVYGTPGGPGSSGQGDPIDWFVADTSDATSRTFIVEWYNHTKGVTTLDIVGNRVLDCDTPDTTLPPDSSTSTTVVDTTSTTVQDSTTTTVAETTSTTVDVTTTSTVPEETTTTVQVAPTTTPQTTPETLPFTGVESEDLAIVAFLAVAAGVGLLATTRRSAEIMEDNN